MSNASLHLTVTPRQFLASLNPPQAVLFGKDGVSPARGRFSTEGTATLAKAREDGYLFLGDEGNEHNPVEPVKEKKVAAPKPAPAPAAEGAPAPVKTVTNLPQTDPKEVRAWAKQNGHVVGERGRIHTTVVQAFLAAGGKAVVPTAKRITPLDMPKKVRRETTGFVFAPRPEGAGKHVSTPLVRVSACGYCSAGVAFCNCPDGPRAPIYLGGAALTLDKPTA